MSCTYQDRLDYIADYVRGELPESEQETFETHYLGCDECLNDIRLMEKATLAMHHYGGTVFAPKTTWLDRLNIWWDELPLSPQWRTAIPSLATYVLLIGILSAGYYWFNSSLNKNGGHFYGDQPGGMVPEHLEKTFVKLEHFDWAQPPASTTESALFNRLAAIQPVYQARNYRLAADRLAAVVADFPQSPEAHLFLGVSQLHLDHTNAATKNLKKVLQMRPDYAPAQWHLAHSYLRQNRFDDARQQLTALIKQKDSQFSALAEQCLKEINRQNK